MWRWRPDTRIYRIFFGDDNCIFVQVKIRVSDLTSVCAAGGFGPGARPRRNPFRHGWQPRRCRRWPLSFLRTPIHRPHTFLPSMSLTPRAVLQTKIDTTTRAGPDQSRIGGGNRVPKKFDHRLFLREWILVVYLQLSHFQLNAPFSVTHPCLYSTRHSGCFFCHRSYPGVVDLATDRSGFFHVTPVLISPPSSIPKTFLL